MGAGDNVFRSRETILIIFTQQSDGKLISTPIILKGLGGWGGMGDFIQETNSLIHLCSMLFDDILNDDFKRREGNIECCRTGREFVSQRVEPRQLRLSRNSRNFDCQGASKPKTIFQPRRICYAAFPFHIRACQTKPGAVPRVIPRERKT